MADLQSQTVDSGKTVYVAQDEVERGSKGPFYVVYATDDAENRWGFLCGNCDSFNTAMDTMGRIECNECGNVRKPDEWDAAHE
ncbi:GNAT family acetyltransferase [Haloferax sp. MBLA0076]|uniref:GNAT family acetyltransferase n=1 Tax=Haloferax litoreum TaxID=2666140 RepID=A0A6A8GHH1_9EURY|nr:MULTISPECIES: DUF5816 domain-containing protein [Haloferax]KAB1193814.1 GNAT family acetyltransferase [Haloferax sp. CBA1148]MRX22356.1 GNAT family acetyltransferase [Haloferax litoreum]